MPSGLSSFTGLPMIVILFAAMYFLMVVPNQRKQKAWQTMLSQIKSGDKITTNGGMRGTVVSVKDDVLIIKTAPDGVKFEIVRSAIAAVTTDEVAKA
jgi:preprotein translocase subunit YajC